VKRALFLGVVIAACDPYGAESARSPSGDAGGDANAPIGEDGAVSSDGGGDGGAGAGKTFIAVFSGSTIGGAYQSKVYVTEVLATGDLAPWQETSALSEPRSRAGAAFIGGSLFVIGGDTGNEITTTPLIGTLTATGTVSGWRAGVPFDEGRVREGVAHVGDRIFVVGGVVLTSQRRADVFVTQPAADGSITGWTPTTALPEPRAAFGMATDGKHLFVVAGESVVDGGITKVSSVLVGDVTPNGASSWRTTTALGLTTAANAAVATSTHLYAAGGFANGKYDYVRAAPIGGDGSLGQWIPMPTMSVQRALFAMVIARGRIYAIGGQVDGDTIHSSVEVADIQANGSLASWRDTTALPVPLTEHCAVTFERP
jgi:hypothetical protein